MNVAVADARDRTSVTPLRSTTPGSPCIAALPDGGAWLTLAWAPAGRRIDAAAAIGGANELIVAAGDLVAPDTPARIVASPSLVARCLETMLDRGPAALQGPAHRSHVDNYVGQPGTLHVEATMPALGLGACSILDFLLPNHGPHMMQTEELAQAALAAGRPDVACRAFREAFVTNPFFSYHGYYRDQYELMALASGDQGEIDAFAENADTARLTPIPPVERNCRLLVFFPVDSERERLDEFPPIEIQPGYLQDKVLILLGNHLLRQMHEDVVNETPDLEFFTQVNLLWLEKMWHEAGTLDRLGIECACVNRFGIPISVTGLVDPPVPEAVAGFAAVKAAPIPPGMAYKPLFDKYQEWKNA